MTSFDWKSLFTCNDGYQTMLRNKRVSHLEISPPVSSDLVILLNPDWYFKELLRLLYGNRLAQTSMAETAKYTRRHVILIGAWRCFKQVQLSTRTFVTVDAIFQLYLPGLELNL